MKPKTKHHHHILDQCKKLRALSKTKKRWIEKTQFWNYWTSHYHDLVCTECNHRWNDSKKFIESYICQKHMQKKSIKCPKCRKLLKFNEHMGAQSSIEGHSGFIEAIGDIQVIRIFRSIKTFSKREKPRFSHEEVVRKVFDPINGKYVAIAKRMNGPMGGYGGGFSYGGEMSIKAYSNPFDYKYMLGDNQMYHTDIVSPWFARAGYRSIVHETKERVIAKLMNPKFETIMKSGYTGLMRREIREIEKFWPAIKIGIRYNYFDTQNINVNDYMDYLKMLDDAGKDLSNPHYVCPENLHEAHQFYVRKIRAKEKQKRIDKSNAEKIKNAARHQKRCAAFTKKMGQYQHLHLQKGKYSVIPFKHLDQLEEEAAELCHCAYQNAYDENDYSILFSCRYDGRVTDTLSFNIDRAQVSECRGYDNKATLQSDEYIELVQMHTDQILSASHSNKKQKLKIA